MCCNVFQCVSSTLGCSAHWAHWNFSMCSAMCTSDNVFRNVLLADFAMRSKHIGLQCAFNVPQCVFNVFFCTLKHIETHCGDCCNNYIKISLIIMCFNVFQCAPNVHPMCSNVFSMCFMHIGILPQISMCRKHIENTFEHIEGTLNVLLIAPRDTGFLRTPLLSTWKSVWAKLPARAPTVRKSYSYSRWNGVRFHQGGDCNDRIQRVVKVE